MNRIERVQLRNRMAPRKPQRKLVVNKTTSTSFYITRSDLAFVFEEAEPKVTDHLLDSALAYGMGMMADKLQEWRHEGRPIEPIAATVLMAQEGDTFFYTITIAELEDRADEPANVHPQPEPNPAHREA